jgi:hypothetical protein
MNQILREILCVTILFGHELVRRGNQYGTQLKCKKCDKSFGYILEDKK